MLNLNDGFYEAIINADEGGVQFKFEHMDLIAEAFGTMHLDFQAMAGKDRLDSYTYDGNLLCIYGRD